MYKRIILKLSGEALSGNSEGSFCDKIIDGIIGQIRDIMKNGTQAALVVGGGNFWRGRDGDEALCRVKSDHIGMLATVMNGLYLSERFRINGMKAKVMTPFTIGALTELFSIDLAKKHLEESNVLIFSGGTGHPFFSTDTMAAIRGSELSCDAILFAKNIDGIYDKDPKKHKDAKKYKEITYREIIKNDLRAVDLAACGLLMETGLASVVFGLNEPNGIMLAASGADEEIYKIGTKVVL